MHSRIQDTVNIELTVEEAIVSDTVKVSVNVVLASKAEDATDVRGTITAALKTLVDIDWAFTKLDRKTNRSGLEEVEATATARVSEAFLAGLDARAKEVSKEGLQLKVSDLDYNPARNVVEEAVLRLRKEIYTKAMAEVATLNEVAEYADQVSFEATWRIGSVSFYEAATPMRSKSMRLEAASYAAVACDATGGSAAMDLTQKVSLAATVALVRVIR